MMSRYCVNIRVMADKLTLISWNVRGLEEANKHFTVYKSLVKYQPAIIFLFFLQETHLVKDTVRCMQRHWIGWECHSMHTSYSRDISILVHKNIPFECVDKEVDEDGRYICVYCKIYHLHYVLVTLYIPPPYNCSVIKKVLVFFASTPMCWESLWEITPRLNLTGIGSRQV